MKINPGLIGVIVIAGLSVALVKSCSDASSLQSDNDVLRSDNSLQGQVIATQAFNFNRFNQVAEHANRLNSLIDTSTEETVIEYREILRREKKPVICLFLLTLLVGCSNTRTVYVPAQCTPIPSDLTQPMIVPLPPAQ